MLLVAVLSVFAINMSADDSKTKGSSVLSSLLESLNGSGSLGEVGNIVQNLISTDNIEIKDIAEHGNTQLRQCRLKVIIC